MMIRRIRYLASNLAALEIWVVGLAVGMSFATERVLPLAIGVSLSFWAIRWIGTSRLSLRTPADWAIAILVLMVPVTLWVTAIPEKTVPQVYRLLAGIALYYAIVNWTTSYTRLRLLTVGIALLGLFLGLYALVSVEWVTGKISFIPSSIYQFFHILVPDTVHRSVMAGNLAILLPIVIALVVFGWRQLQWYEKMLFGLAVLVMAAIIILTQSRGGWVAITVAIFVLAFLRWRNWLMMGLVGFVTAIGLYFAGFGQVGKLMVTTSDTLSSRVEIWSRALMMIRDAPYTGIGMGSFGNVVDALYPLLLSTPGSIPHAHNLFLQVAVDLGIPGLIAWLAVLIVVVSLALQIYLSGYSMKDGWMAGLGAGLLCSQVALGVHGMVDAVTWGMVKTAPLVWALWGIAVANWSLRCVSTRLLQHKDE